MEPLRIHEGLVYPLYRANIDTDQIIPKQFLKRIERSGFGQFLFYHWRFDNDGNPREDFSLNDPKYKGASIIVAGDNFGCGSSREHAPWAVQDYGFRVIIAPSFADIFKNNCVKNGILAIPASEEQVQQIVKKAEAGNYNLTVNLEEQVVTDNEGFELHFDIPAYPKEMLLNGWDEIGVTLKYEDKITEYELAQK
ncbi:3-isopropylmalate dehydratase small subunit [Neobacillus sp. PS3-12]|jgi:3-isopropylmalate/(R)-2-methylmalate dehydratase small subunit|uniref:3-isopropylmalate dehydratase small subunit n=1 Tax=Neobacillus sp. PS3-12 TaxID=3070677 RepID=UPI0027E06F86|nr:3-isopropylmalate dehydratase small subunit [Neobacillus sp. PS3-12]WML51036.1 3-isopropylmalate dehydratase small subunit [Neobacillus sp. PS3-12]